MKIILKVLAMFVCVLIIAAGAFVMDIFKRADLVLPRTVIGDLSLGGMSRSEVRTALRSKLEAYNNESFQIAARGKAASVTLKDIGVGLNESLVMSQIPFARDLSNLQIVFESFIGRRILPEANAERTDFLRLVDEKFPEIPRAQNARFKKEGKALKIVEAANGVTPVADAALIQLKKDIAFLEHRPLFIEFIETAPSVKAADLERNKAAILSVFPKSIKLFSGKTAWKADFEKHPEWLIFDAKPYEVAVGQLPFTIQWDSLSFSQFIQDAVSKTLEQAPEDVKISKDRGGETAGLITFEGRGIDGVRIEKETLLRLANLAIANQEKEVEIPLAQVAPKVEIDPELQDIGIRELISVGHTKFAGSPANRMHNIGIGMSRFNGVLIPQGETFSFNKNLGPVDETTGYKKELVIKPEGTIPEFGGGLCQVSTTMYRAAMYAGMPIAERAPHSYAVTYYSQIGGHGLDATIYPPSRDLRFTNDTPGSVLMQAYVDGADAYFKFYGTSDGRTVVLDGPYISNRKEAPKEAVTVVDPKLKIGEKKQVEKAHPGFDALWYRNITRGDKIKKEEIISRYRAVPDKFLIGGPAETAQISAGAGTTSQAEEPVNPYE